MVLVLLHRFLAKIIMRAHNPKTLFFDRCITSGRTNDYPQYFLYRLKSITFIGNIYIHSEMKLKKSIF